MNAFTSLDLYVTNQCSAKMLPSIIKLGKRASAYMLNAGRYVRNEVNTFTATMANLSHL